MKARRRRLITLSIVLACLTACAPGSPGAETGDGAVAGSLVGQWRAVLMSPGGDLPFTLEIADDGGALRGAVLNGDERALLSGIDVEGDRVTFRFDWYDSSIDARFDSEGSLVGRWHKTVPDGVSALDFVAKRGAAERFLPVHEERPAANVTDVGGVWAVEFIDEDGTDVAQAEFRQDGSRVMGTFLTTAGDYRFLEGTYVEGLLRLSTFDGAHAFLFQARADDDALVGDFWSRDSYHATWTARRASEGETILPDAWGLAGLTNDQGAFHFAFDDLAGHRVASDDARFAGKVVVVNIFGSWCPNCNDEAPLLAEWARRYRDRGLEIVGLAYEYSGDTDRDRLFVGRYAERHGIDYPLLLAGVSDRKAAAETLPDITSVVAFPTTLFIGRDGKVRKVHSGFSGPGTGAHYDELRGELESLIESLLAEPAQS
jgi:thiol-disulfide isomerase/thioredoxin